MVTATSAGVERGIQKRVPTVHLTGEPADVQKWPLAATCKWPFAKMATCTLNVSGRGQQMAQGKEVGQRGEPA